MSKSNKKKTNLPFLTNLEDFESPGLGDLENDASLEAELLELMGGGGNPPPKRERNIKKEMKPIAIDNNLLNLDLNDDINDADIDENDPELLAELHGFLNESSPEKQVEKKNVSSLSQGAAVEKLEHLRNLYQEAIKQATASNDASKSRRYDRSLKSINELLQKALKGQPVDESEFPPPVHVNPVIPISKPIEQKPSIEPPNKTFRASSPPKPQSRVLEALTQRQNEYKHAAIEQRSKDIELAKGLMAVFKKFTEVIEDVKKGAPFDLSDLPPPPSEFQLSDLNEQEAEELPPAAKLEPAEQPAMQPFGEELKLRLAFYTESVAKATAENVPSKVRRLNRVVQQYQEAIEAFRRNAVFAYDELPPPPGRPPLPSPNVATKPEIAAGKAGGEIRGVGNHEQVAKSGKQDTRISKTAKYLSDRHTAFKSAALKAKLEGNLPLAKELLRNAMALEKMVQAAESGLPVDLSQVPSLPSETNDFNFGLVVVEECDIPQELRAGSSRESVLKQLQIALLEQIKMCRSYASTVTLAGDVIEGKRFEELGKSCEKDLHALRGFIDQKNADSVPLPRFHYEYRSFSIMQSNPDLGEHEMSVEIVRGMNYALPSGYTADQFDTYVVLELPFPSDAVQTATTETVRRSNSPQYNFIHKFQVNLKSRVFQRVVKSKQLKADIYYRKGFLQKDKLYGTSMIKLDKLETKCSIHDTFDIVENRKVVAGKLEVKVRVRNPVLSNQSQLVKEKWLVIDDFNANHHSAPPMTVTGTGCPSGGSIDVLKYEIGEMKRKLVNGGPQVTQALATALRQKIAEKESVARAQEEKLRSGDASAWGMYLQSILKLPQEFNDEAKRYLGENKRDKAQMAMTKKKLVEKEIEQLKNSRRKS